MHGLDGIDEGPNGVVGELHPVGVQRCGSWPAVVFHVGVIAHPVVRQLVFNWGVLVHCDRFVATQQAVAEQPLVDALPVVPVVEALNEHFGALFELKGCGEGEISGGDEASEVEADGLFGVPIVKLIFESESELVHCVRGLVVQQLLHVESGQPHS